MSASAMRHLSIANLYSNLKKSTNDEAALAITTAFEEFAQDQELRVVENKRELAEEINFKSLTTKDDIKNFVTKDDVKNFATKDDINDLRNEAKNFATKDDLKDFVTKEELKSEVAGLRVEFYKEISSAKWQVIGTMLFLFVTSILLKHLGF